MQATSAGFTAAVLGTELTVAARVQLGLPAVAASWNDITLTVDSITIDASTTTDMPSGTRLQVGYPAREATIVLSGFIDPNDETKTAAWAFNPYSTDSLLYRSDVLSCSVTVDLGLVLDGSLGVPEYVRKFTGWVNNVAVDPQGGTVTLTCIDNRALLRSVPDIPAVVLAEPYNNGLTSEYAVDALLRSATGGAISSWPKPRTDVRLSVGFRTSVWAETGVFVQSGYAPLFAPGAHGTGMTADPTVGYASSYVLSKPLSSLDASPVGIYTEFTITNAAQSYTSPVVPGIQVAVSGAPWASGESFYLDLVPTGVTVQVAGGTTITVAPALDSGTHHIACQVLVNFSTNRWLATVWIDGVPHATGSQVGAGTTNSSGGGTETTSLILMGGGVMEGLQITGETAGTPSYPFTSTAVLDPSLNTLQVVPAVTGDPWQVIQQIADAELAVAGFDELGVFRFVNRGSLAKQPVVRDVTSSTSLKQLQIGVSAAAVANRVTVPYASWTFAPPGQVYALQAPWSVPAGATRTLTAKLDTPTGGIDPTLVQQLPNGHTTSDGSSWCRVSLDKAGVNSFNLISALMFEITQPNSQTVKITVTNTYNRAAWFVSSADFTDLPAGTPSLWLGGVAVTLDDELLADVQWPPAADGGAASSRWGEVAYQAPSNPWVQDGDSAVGLAQDILADSPRPRPDLTDIDIFPDWRLQLTDRIRLLDPDRSKVDEHAVLFGENIQLSSGQLQHTIDARAVTFPGGWLLGVAGRTELGVTTHI